MSPIMKPAAWIVVAFNKRIGRPGQLQLGPTSHHRETAVSVVTPFSDH